MPSKNNIPAAGNSNAVSNELGVNEAHDLMLQALKLLDMNHGPHDVRAHLDLAINRLQLSIDEPNDAA